MHNIIKQSCDRQGRVAELSRLFEEKANRAEFCAQSQLEIKKLLAKDFSKSQESLNNTLQWSNKMMIEMDLEAPIEKINNLHRASKPTESKEKALKIYHENLTLERPIPAPRRKASTSGLQQKSEITFQEAKQSGRLESVTRRNVEEMDKEIAKMQADDYVRASLASGSNCTGTESEESDEEASIYDNVKTILGDCQDFFATPNSHAKEEYMTCSDGAETAKAVQGICSDNVTLKSQNSINSLKARQFKTSRAILNIIEHLKATEKRHLQELTAIIPVYLYAINNHALNEIKSCANTLTDNLEGLLKIQMNFETCVAQARSLDIILRAFIDFQDLFHSYKKFFMGNHCALTFTLSDPKNDFTKEITLGAILNQRLFHYKMMLEEIQAELSGYHDCLQVVASPLSIISGILNICNVKNVLDKIVPVPVIQESALKESDVKPLAVASCPFDVYGNYLLKNKFKVTKPLKYALTVFLFKNVVLLTREENKDIFYYQGHIRMDEVILLPLNEKKKKILKFYHYDKSRRFHMPVVYKFEATTKETQEVWRSTIIQILGEQHEEMRWKAYQKHLKDST